MIRLGIATTRRRARGLGLEAGPLLADHLRDEREAAESGRALVVEALPEEVSRGDAQSLDEALLEVLLVDIGRPGVRSAVDGVTREIREAILARGVECSNELLATSVDAQLAESGIVDEAEQHEPKRGHERGVGLTDREDAGELRLEGELLLNACRKRGSDLRRRGDRGDGCRVEVHSVDLDALARGGDEWRECRLVGGDRRRGGGDGCRPEGGDVVSGEADDHLPAGSGGGGG